MDLLYLFKFYTTSVIVLLGVLIMLSPLILGIYRKKEKNNGPKDLSMLFSKKDFLTKKGLIVRFYIKKLILILLMLTIINFFILDFLF